MASNIDMSLDDISRMKFAGQRKFSRSTGGAVNKFKSSQDKPTDLRSVLAKKQTANITDLRAKLKPKALYTSKHSSKSQSSIPAATTINGSSDGQGRKKLKLTTSFKNSVSSAVSGPKISEDQKLSRSRSRRSDLSSGSQRRTSSSNLPSYEEAKKISVTVPGLSKPISEVRDSVLIWLFSL